MRKTIITLYCKLKSSIHSLIFVQPSTQLIPLSTTFFCKLRTTVFKMKNHCWKETLEHGFFCGFCKVFKNIYFIKHLWMTASILQQLLALYFAIIYSWQLSIIERSFGKKFHPYISRNVYIFFAFFVFLIFFDKFLPVTQSVCCCTLSIQPFCRSGDTQTQWFWPILKT